MLEPERHPSISLAVLAHVSGSKEIAGENYLGVARKLWVSLRGRGSASTGRANHDPAPCSLPFHCGLSIPVAYIHTPLLNHATWKGNWKIFWFRCTVLSSVCFCAFCNTRHCLFGKAASAFIHSCIHSKDATPFGCSRKFVISVSYISSRFLPLIDNSAEYQLRSIVRLFDIFALYAALCPQPEAC